MINRVRGTRDILALDFKSHQLTLDKLVQNSRNWGYSCVCLPTLEQESLYRRTLGSDSDIVLKEMFKIQDKEIVLRPEGTAGAIRAYIQNCRLGEKQRWYYHGSMFRHERPQAGRYREFYQFGIENIGVVRNPFIDADVISLAYQSLQDLNVPFKLVINNLGNSEQRKSYTQKLFDFFESHKEKLSDLSIRRLYKGNVLRILDSKEPEDIQIAQEAPRMTEFIKDKDFDQLQEVLKGIGIEFTLDPFLVRGLDYYSHTCFEFVGPSKLTLIAGGRYDSLASYLGAPSEVPAIGWAAGVNRIAQHVQTTTEKAVGVVSIGNTHLACLKASLHLRKNNISVIYDPFGSLKTQMKHLKELAKYVIFIGEEEEKTNVFTVKNLDTGEETKTRDYLKVVKD